MVFSSGPTIRGPMIVVYLDLRNSIRTHIYYQLLILSYYDKSCGFYKKLEKRLCDWCTALKHALFTKFERGTEVCGGNIWWIYLRDTFESEQFKNVSYKNVTMFFVFL